MPQGLAFLYCGKLDPEGHQTSSPLLHSLIRQLLALNDQRAIKSVKKLARLWDDAESGKQEPAKDVIAESLLAILGFYPATTIALDGLDRLTPCVLSDFETTLGSALEASQSR